MPDNQQNSKVATDLRLFVSALRSQQPTVPRVIDAEVWATLPSPCTLLWIENSSVTDGWQLSDEHIITGVPHNEWQLTLHFPAVLGILIGSMPAADTFHTRPVLLPSTLQQVSEWFAEATST